MKNKITGFEIIFIGFSVNWLQDQRKLRQDENWEEPLLPGLNLTQRQLFWVAFGQTNCEKFKNEALIRYLKTDSHSPGEYRVKGSLRNNANFAKDFACPIESPMNPSSRYLVW